MFERVQMPPFAGAVEWLGSEPLGPAELRGHVVLVNFWTLTCINWLRQEPHVRAWAQTYRDAGLVVIGVHTPEFSFEHEIDRVRHAIKEREIDYPRARRQIPEHGPRPARLITGTESGASMSPSSSTTPRHARCARASGSMTFRRHEFAWFRRGGLCPSLPLTGRDRW